MLFNHYKAKTECMFVFLLKRVIKTTIWNKFVW